jgi:hypothetical protein
MQKLQYFAIVLLISGTLFSCKKDSGTSAPTKTDLLTKADWKAVNIEVDTIGVFFSVWPLVPTCGKDDITTYKADHTYKVAEGATKCKPTDPDIFESGSWQFSADEKLLILQGTDNYTIDILTDTDLKLTIRDGTFGYRFTYTH